MTRPRVYLHGPQRTRARPCPVCREVLDAATPATIDDPTPPRMRPGDLTRCAFCSAVLVVTYAGFRLATDADLETLPPELRRILTFGGGSS